MTESFPLPNEKEYLELRKRSQLPMAELKAGVIINFFNALVHPENYPDFCKLSDYSRNPDGIEPSSENSIKDPTISSKVKSGLILRQFKPITTYLFTEPYKYDVQTAYDRTINFIMSEVEKPNTEQILIPQLSGRLDIVSEILPDRSVMEAMISCCHETKIRTPLSCSQLEKFIDRVFCLDPQFPRFEHDV